MVESAIKAWMKRRTPIVSLLLVSLVTVAGSAWWFVRTPNGRARATANPQSLIHAEFEISGMDCLMCAAGLQNQLRALPGVVRAEVSYQDKRAVVEFDPRRTDAAHLARAIEDSGFKVTPISPFR